MVRTVKTKEKEKKKVGRKPKLIVEDQILMTLQYLREYRTYYHIGKDWKMSESNVCRIVLKIENILIKSLGALSNAHLNFDYLVKKNYGKVL